MSVEQVRVSGAELSRLGEITDVERTARALPRQRKKAMQKGVSSRRRPRRRRMRAHRSLQSMGCESTEDMKGDKL